MSKKVIIYTIEPCPYCTNAKSLLDKHNIPYQEIFVERSDHDMIMELMQKSGMRTFPQIFCDDKLIGGYTELVKLHEEKGLQNELL